MQTKTVLVAKSFIGWKISKQKIGKLSPDDRLLGSLSPDERIAQQNFQESQNQIKPAIIHSLLAEN